MKRIFGQSLLFTAIVSVVLADGLPMANTNSVESPDIPQPGYLESYIDPVFGAKVTRITGEPGTDILNIKGKWSKIARHHYSKDAAWNCDQSILLLGTHHCYPSMLFLDGTTYRPLFGRNKSPGSDMRWHPAEPGLMVYVKDNIIGYWDVRKDKTQVVAAFRGYSEFRIGPGEGNLSLDGRVIVVDGKKGKDRIAFAYNLQDRRKYSDLVFNDVEIDWVSVSASGKYIVLNGRINSRKGDQTQIYDLDGNNIGELWASAWGATSGRPIGAYVAQRVTSEE